MEQYKKSTSLYKNTFDASKDQDRPLKVENFKSK